MISIRLYYSNEKGSVLVFATVIIIIMLMLAFLHIVIGFIFRDQVIVLDALDSAVTAALSQAEEKHRNTYYYEKLEITDYIRIDGVDFPIEYKWIKDESTEGYAGNYVYLSHANAYNYANEYFNKYLELNDVDYEIKNFHLEVDYDDERWLPVVNTRYATFQPNEPYPWWQDEFGDDGSFQFPNQLIYVRFPRWVTVTINTTIEMPIPFGIGLSNMLDLAGPGDEDKSNFLSIKRSYVSSGLKELKVIDPPPIFAWE